MLLGHGSYMRHLRLGGGECISVRVQRFLCTSCRKTTSLLPSEIIPRRRYAGPVILQALVDHMMHGQSSRAVKARVSPGEGASAGWKTLLRWKRAALRGFWSSWAAQLGLSRSGKAGALEEGPGRLARLLGFFGADSMSSPRQLHEVARSLTAGWRPLETAHMEGQFVPTGRGAGAGAELSASAYTDPTRNVRRVAAGTSKGAGGGEATTSCPTVSGGSGLRHSIIPFNEQELLAARAKPSP